MMKKRLLACILTGAMTLSLAAPAAFGAQETVLAKTEAAADTETAAAPGETEAENGARFMNDRVWDTDVSMAFLREDALRKEKDMSLSEWDGAVDAKKQEGKAHPLTEEAVLADHPDAQILEEDGVIYYISRTDALGEVADALDAYRAAYSAAALMGGNELADLRLWHQMDINDMRIYSFQQISDSTMVLGSTLKIAVRDGRVSAVFSSLNPEEGKDETIVTQAGAENAVLDELEAQGRRAEVLPEYTDRIRYTPTSFSDLNLDTMDDEPVPEELRWVIYSENEGDEEYPYLANYTDLAGNYLESLPVTAPGSNEARYGFRRQNVFGGMTADTWTGEILGPEDERKTVTLPVMRDRDGKWYLGDVVRRIAVADFAKAVYDDSHTLELVESDDGASFDNEDLYMYYNYLNAWEFYEDMGWTGPDGEANDVIILKGLCTSDGTAFENACSLGMVQGWQMFGYTAYTLDGSPLRLGNGLDVMAHEYTHTFTSTVMNSNLYENDQGAINEAMSDIMGNLVELILEETDDTRWLLGEQTGKAIRSMSDPVAYQQPAYVWDKYYGPQTDTPNGVNDHGGVHFNSSLLNRIAAKLCMDEGMKLEDAARFWILVTGGLTPETDYSRICALLRWAMKESGNEEYLDSLNRMIDEEHLEREEIPGKLPYNRKIVHLSLPDTEAFADQYWALMTVSLNTETIRQFAGAALRMAVQFFRDPEDTGKISMILSDFLESIHMDGSRIRLKKNDSMDAVADAIKDTVTAAISRLVEQGLAWRAGEGEDITFVTDDSPTFYILINLTEAATKINGIVVLVGSRWIDYSPFAKVLSGLIKMDLKENKPKKDSTLETLGKITPQQWSVLAETAAELFRMAAKALSGESGSWTQEQSPDAGEILNTARGLLEYALADDETKKNGLQLPARTQELPVDGLEKVRLAE